LHLQGFHSIGSSSQSGFPCRTIGSLASSLCTVLFSECKDQVELTGLRLDLSRSPFYFSFFLSAGQDTGERGKSFFICPLVSRRWIPQWAGWRPKTHGRHTEIRLFVSNRPVRTGEYMHRSSKTRRKIKKRSLPSASNGATALEHSGLLTWRN
jgi:hypothetical protein